MARRKRLMNKKLGNMSIRALFNAIVGGLIFGLMVAGLSFLAGFGQLVGSIAAVVALMFIIPAILRMRPGAETFEQFIFGVPTGLALLGVLGGLLALVGVGLPSSIVQQTVEVGVLTTLALAFGSYFASDLVYLMLFRKRR